LRISAARAALGPTADDIGPATLDIRGSTFHSVEPGVGEAELVLSSRYVVVPALINSHTHLALSSLRGVGGLASLGGNVVEDLYFRVERHMTADDVHAFTRIGAYEALLTGTGLVWDHYYCARAVAAALDEVGLCGAVAATLQDVTGPGASSESESWSDLDYLLKQDTPGIAPVLGPHATDTVSDRLWSDVRDHAAATGLPVHAHLAQSPEEVRRSWSEHGCSPLARLRRLGVLSSGPPVLLAHGLYVSEADLAPLSGEDAVLAYCPAAQAQFDFPASADAWRAAGGSVALGTDAGSCNDSVDVQSELRLAALAPAFALPSSPERRALSATLDEASLSAMVSRRAVSHRQQRSPSQLLEMVWSVPGSLHPRLPAGRLAAGTLANLAIYDTWHPSMWPGTDPLQALVYGRCSGALHGMVLRGRWIGERGTFHESLLSGDGYRTAAREASAKLSALLQRAGLSG
jgi:cytosine/adenosine deaminase-related metal-dependent hydrolase